MEQDPNVVKLLSILHDIRSPLNAVIGFADLIKTTPNALPESKEYAGYILDSGYRLNDKINEVIKLLKELHDIK